MNMAEGGDNREDNPFSFKKFIKAKSKDRSSSDSDIDDSEEDIVVDLLDNSSGQSKGIFSPMFIGTVCTIYTFSCSLIM